VRRKVDDEVLDKDLRAIRLITIAGKGDVMNGGCCRENLNDTRSICVDKMEAKASSLRAQTAVVRPAQARPTKLFTLASDILRSTGALSVRMVCHKPGEGLREQVHFNRDEVFFVIEGTYQLTADDQTCRADPGTIVLVPRTVAHRFENVGITMARILDWSLGCREGLPLYRNFVDSGGRKARRYGGPALQLYDLEECAPHGTGNSSLSDQSVPVVLYGSVGSHGDG